MTHVSTLWLYVIKVDKPSQSNIFHPPLRAIYSIFFPTMTYHVSFIRMPRVDVIVLFLTIREGDGRTVVSPLATHPPLIRPYLASNNDYLCAVPLLFWEQRFFGNMNGKLFSSRANHLVFQATYQSTNHHNTPVQLIPLPA